MNSSEWRKKSFTWGKRLTLVVLILFGACYGVLALAERSTDALRQGFQQQLTKASGYDAEITEMISAKLVPTAAFRMKGIYLRQTHEKHKSEKTMLKIDQAYIETSFLSIMTGIGKYYGFEFKGVEIASGLWFPKKADLEFAGISDPSPESAPAVFLLDGIYNDLPLLITAELDRKIKSRGPNYSLPSKFPVTFKLGTIEGHATYQRDFLSAGVYDGVMTRGRHEMRFKLESGGGDPLVIKCRGALDGVYFNADLIISGDDKTLNIFSESENEGDLENLKSFVGDIVKDLGFSEDQLKITYGAAPSAASRTKDE